MWRRLYSARFVYALAVVAMPATASAFVATRALAQAPAVTAIPASVNREVDEMKGITWYFPRDRVRLYGTETSVFPYVGERPEKSWALLRLHTEGEDWLFWRKVYFLIDGARWELAIDPDNKKEDVVGHVSETLDMPVTADILVHLRAIAGAQAVVVRFEGPSLYRDYKLTSDDKHRIVDMLAVIDAKHVAASAP